MGLITDQIRATASAALDLLMQPTEQGGLGKHCTLIFPDQETRCPNCIFDAQNKRSANRHQAGGPQPFPHGGLCPVCVGVGTLNTPVTEDIIFLLNWRPRTWQPMPGIDPSNVYVEAPGGFAAVQSKGFVSDIPRVLKSRRAVIETPVQGVQRYTFTLAGEPADVSNIVQGRYFLALWTRASQ